MCLYRLGWIESSQSVKILCLGIIHFYLAIYSIFRNVGRISIILINDVLIN